MSPLPLDGVRILALTQLGAGPYGMTMLGDLGAEIIKIEDPSTGGDEARNVPPEPLGGDSLYYQSFNRNTRSLTINLRTAGGRALFRRLAALADAVYANPRGDLPAKLGLDYASLRDVNPRLVCCTLTGFGRSGPRAADPAYDYLIQGLAGFMHVTGEPDGPPVRSGVEPQRLPGGSHPTVVPAQTFATRDGWMLVMCMKEKFWARLTDLIGRPDLARDPRYAGFSSRLANRDALLAELEPIFRARPTAEWIALLRGQVPCAPVNTIGAALADEQTLHRDMIVAVEHPRYGALREIGCPIKIDGVEPRYRPGPPLGADTDAILRDWLHMSPTEIAALRDEGAV